MLVGFGLASLGTVLGTFVAWAAFGPQLGSEGWKARPPGGRARAAVLQGGGNEAGPPECLPAGPTLSAPVAGAPLSGRARARAPPARAAGAQVAAALCASYVGGSVNFAAVAASLGLAPGPLLVAAMAADNICMAGFFALVGLCPAAPPAGPAPALPAPGAARRAVRPSRMSEFMCLHAGMRARACWSRAACKRASDADRSVQLSAPSPMDTCSVLCIKRSGPLDPKPTSVACCAPTPHNPGFTCTDTANGARSVLRPPPGLRP